MIHRRSFLSRAVGSAVAVVVSAYCAWSDSYDGESEYLDIATMRTRSEAGELIEHTLGILPSGDLEFPFRTVVLSSVHVSGDIPYRVLPYGSRDGDLVFS